MSEECRIEKEPLDRQLETMIDEARMILPGEQALFGFQMIAVFNEGFSKKLAPADQLVHLAAMLTVLAAMGLTIAPAAYHRLAEPETVSKHFARVTSRLLTGGLFLLMLGLAADVYVFSMVVLGSAVAAVSLAAAATVALLAMWFVYPLASRQSRIAEIGRAEMQPTEA